MKKMRNLQIYVHIPFCYKKCAYCDFLSFSCDEETQSSYVDALIREIKFYGKQMKDAQVSTIFVGGGTPTWLHEDKMVEILETIYASFSVSDDAEITMECNPGTVTKTKLEKYKKAGVNRLSIGLQSANDDELRILGRIHTYGKFVETFGLARNAGFTNINVDLISGIPYQTAEKFMYTLQKVVALKPNHISAYSLIVEEGTPFYDKYRLDLVLQEAGKPTIALPTEDEVYRITKLTQQYLAQAGYKQYEISNFARPGYECIHNIGYWIRENYLGLGLGAASLLNDVRYANETDLDSYISATKDIQMLPFEQENGRIEYGTNLHSAVEAIPRKAQMEEFMFLGLRRIEGVTRQQFQDKFGIPIDAIYQDVMSHLKAEGLLEIHAGQIALTEKGQDLSNYALAQFLL